MHVHKLYNISIKSHKNWFLLENTIHSYQLKPTKPTSPNQPPLNKNIHPTPPRPGRARLQYFEESSPLICVDRTPHDPPGYSLGETNPRDPKKRPYLKGPSEKICAGSS